MDSIDDLNKYPLRFIPFRQTSTECLVNKLKAKPRQRLNHTAQPASLTVEQIEFFKTWRDESLHQPVDQSLESFFKGYRKLGYQGEAKTEFIGQTIYYNTLQANVNSKVMTQDIFVTEAIGVVQALLTIIEKLLGELQPDE